MKANNIEPKPYTTFDSIMAIGDAAKKAWGEIIMVSKFIPRSERAAAKPSNFRQSLF
jgi:hypothetical protein